MLEESRRAFEKCLKLSNGRADVRSKVLLRLAHVLTEGKELTLASASLQEAQELDQQHGVFSDQERADLNRLSSVLASGSQ
jgi:hypothetical protein